MAGQTEHVSVASPLHTNKVLVILLAGTSGMLIGLLDAKSKVNPIMEDITDCEETITFFPAALCGRYSNW